MLEKNILQLQECYKVDVSLVGGKASNLAFLQRNGLKVPDAFVITTHSAAVLIPDLANMILQSFDDLGTTYVAVRSSATAEDGDTSSWAGQFETYLNVKKADLLDAVQNCWNSVNNLRAVEYAKQSEIPMGPKNMAVIVQTMVQSQSAGVAFSINPLTQNIDEVMIEAGFGLGEAVVSGEITPDNYIVSKSSGNVEKNISKQEKMLKIYNGSNRWEKVIDSEQSIQKISDTQLKNLFDQIVNIEKIYLKPMDIEWAIFENQIYITQARPITTLS